MKKLQLRTDGLTGEALAFAKKWNDNFSELEIMDINAVQEQVRATIKPFLNDKNEFRFDVNELVDMMSDGEKGVRHILTEQGKALAKLQETATATTAESFRSILSSKMKDIQKAMQKREGFVKLNVRAAAIMTTENTIDGHADLPEDLIESFSIGAFVEKRQNRPYIWDIASRNTVAEIDQYKTWLEEGDIEGGFAIVAEGGLKPLISAGLIRNYSEFFKVAAKYVVTEEFQKFRKTAYAIIRRMIMQKLTRDYESLLTTRLLADAASYVGSALDGQYPANVVTDYHAVAAVAAQIEALNFKPDTLILNPQDKWRIGMSQDLNGQFYLYIPVTDPSGETRMMGFNLRTSNEVAVGNFILGESGLWNIDDEPIQVKIGYGLEVIKNGEGEVTDVEGDFDHNRMRVIVELFANSWIGSSNIGSFVYGNFDTIKEAVSAEEVPAG